MIEVLFKNEKVTNEIRDMVSMRNGFQMLKELEGLNAVTFAILSFGSYLSSVLLLNPWMVLCYLFFMLYCQFEVGYRLMLFFQHRGNMHLIECHVQNLLLQHSNPQEEEKQS